MKTLSAIVAMLFISQIAWANPEPVQKAWLSGMLSKVVSFAQSQVKKDDEVPVAVAGLRGSQKKEVELEPYWKGEVTVRPQDFKAWKEIEKKMQEGAYQEALAGINQFKGQFIKSRLMPQVQFTLGLALAGLGKNKEAVTAFQDVIKQYPEHELVGACKEGITRLNKA